jgi:Tol biopolymer transport system component
VISADGRYVAFGTDGQDLAASNQPRLPAHGPWFYNVYVRDMRTGLVQLVSIGRRHTLANTSIDNFSMSADGRYFAFQTAATNMVADDSAGRRLPNGQVLPDVYLRDRIAGTTIRIGRASRPDGYGKYHPSTSPDGRYVAFYSNDPKLIPAPTTYSECGDTAIPGACGFIHQLDPPYQVYRFDRVTKRTAIASVSPTGVAGNFDSELPDQGAVLSTGGRYLVFSSNATNLVPGDDDQQTGFLVDGTPDVYVRDMTTGTTTRVSVGLAGLPGDNLSSDATISANGEWIAFDSIAENLAPGDTNGIAPGVTDVSSQEQGEDIFIANRLTGNIARVSVDSDGQQANGDSYRPVISGDGSCVAFISRADNLVANDTNQWSDGFVHCYQPPASLIPTAARS